jgi:hypothetical protein
LYVTCWFGSVLVLTCDIAKTIPVSLRLIPARLWSPEALTRVDFLLLPSICGRLDANFEIVPNLKGAFKTAHSGSVTLDAGGALPPSLLGNVCVKQVYFSGEGGAVKRYPSAEEKTYIHSEVGCLDWARILLNLTYQFVEAHKRDQEDFEGIIPNLHFVEAAIAESYSGKSFLVEEWINTSKVPFTKYINNACAVSCIPPHAPEEMKNIANFLCFAQHVQYQVTQGTVFTSDYQGVSQQ